jgi:hypothetical protein
LIAGGAIGHLIGLFFITGITLGPFLYYGTRTDDPNDIVPHEDSRDLRGLYVFAAWLNHYDTTALNTLDTLVEENGVPFIRHNLIEIRSSDSYKSVVVYLRGNKIVGIDRTFDNLPKLNADR